MSGPAARPAVLRPIDLRLDPEVRPLVRVAWLLAGPLSVEPSGAALRREVEEVSAGLVRRHAGRPPAAIDGLAAARELYRSFAIDPTRTRPSSEALLRRVLRGQPLPRISNAVDAGNLCSLLFLLPVGLFDVDRIRPPVTLRRGRAGETYTGIRKEAVHLAGRPVLCDAERPFGNPTSDSADSAVGAATTRVWLTIFAPRSLPPEVLVAHTATADELFRRHLAGSVPLETSRGVAD